MNFQRQLDILDPRCILYPITLIGCGGIGSPTALVLAKIGCPNLILMDPDTVEDHNLPNQLFPLVDTDKPKVDACKEMVLAFADCSIRTMPAAFDGIQDLSGIVISGVDTMKVRQQIWEKVKFNLGVPLYIDGRIGGEIIEVYTIQPSQIEDIEFYEKFLFPEEEAAELPCTARAILYTGFVAAGLIASQLKKWLKGGEKYYRRVNLDLKTMTSLLQ